MVKMFCFTSSKKEHEHLNWLFKEAFGRAPAAVDNHSNPQDGGRAKWWVIHQKMVLSDLDSVHDCSSPFTCLIKS